MSDYQVTFARHTGSIKDEVTDRAVNRNEFNRIVANEFVQIGVDTYQRVELTDRYATYLSIHPLRLTMPRAQTTEELAASLTRGRATE